MAKIAVFDSGLGSLSIITSIQNALKSDITYLADQRNYPYGTKTKTQLDKIIKKTILDIKQRINPDIIIVGSNTPTILLDDILDDKTFGVLPPIVKAQTISRTKKIAILATQNVIKSSELNGYIAKHLSKDTKISKINASQLVHLVESGKFINDKDYCIKKIKDVIASQLDDIDVATLSSTHLPFLIQLLKKQYPHVRFIDPADDIARNIAKCVKNTKRNSLKIFTSGNPDKLEKYLRKLGIKNKINSW